MAKTESTAVNQLINLVATQQPPAKNPDEDLMFQTPAKRASAPRISSTVPQHAMEVAPLPRTRAPQGTQQGLPTISESPAVRVSTAPPSRGNTVPSILAPQPLQAPQAPPPLPPRALESMRPSRTSLPPPPVPRSAPRTTAAQPVAVQPVAFQPVAQPVAVQPVVARPIVVVHPVATRPVAAEPVAAEPVATPVPVRTSAPPMPVAAPLAYSMPEPFAAQASSDMTSNQDWFDQNDLLSDRVPIQQNIGTDQLSRLADWKSLARKLVGPMVVLVIIGVFIGGYIAFDGQGGKPRATVAAATSPAPTATAPAEPAPASTAQTAPTQTGPAPAATAQAEIAQPSAQAEPAQAEPAPVEPITPPNLAMTEPAKTEPAKTEPAITEPAKTQPVTTQPEPAVERPTFVDVRIDSKPAGATVMLVDRGKTTFLGTTPVSAAVDPSRRYDLVFTYDNKPTQIEHLNAATTKHLSVVLGRSGNRPASKAARVAKSRAVVKAAVDPLDTAPPAETKPVGEGVLMISSKPPCEILIDGKSTGLMTPQREIKLPAGSHRITLVNATEKIKKTLAVQITADQPTKVIQDLMK
ncbi:MAG: serine/threonine protein kinase [Deltaproteobacteria bacterium]|nr:serine/threonine protein kinase [Deltaproteobacteria bacterium]